MATTVEIDLNVRVHGGQTYSGYEDVSGPLAVGDVVEVFEPESGVRGPGRVTDIDAAKRLVYCQPVRNDLGPRKIHVAEPQVSNLGHERRVLAQDVPDDLGGFLTLGVVARPRVHHHNVPTQR